MQISLSRPDITQKEIDAVVEVLKTPVLSIGPKVEKFEEALARYTGVKYGIAVGSGTAGLHLLIRSLGIGPGDEVITTPFSFVASANCIVFEGAVPVFADIDAESMNIDPGEIEKKITSRTKAILPVHVFGRLADMEAIMDIARRYRLAVIEDACEALGAGYQGQKAGSFGTAAVFAFYPNKQITTGEGGMIVTNDPEIAGLCRSLRNQGRAANSPWLEHERLGYNYRLDEIRAALGIAQMERLPEILAKRARVAESYNKKLARLPGIILPVADPPDLNSWFVYVIRLRAPLDRDRVMAFLHQKGIQCRSYFPPIHLQKFYRDQFGYQGGEFPVTELVARQTLALPFYNNLTEAEMDYVVACLEEAVGKLG